MYHIVAADSRAARTGKFLEVIGRYEPMQQPALISTREDRLFYWLRHGALPTDTVRSLLRKNGAWMKWSLKKKGADEATITREVEKWQMLQDAKSLREVEKKSRRVAKKKETGQPATEAAVGAPAATPPADATA